MVRKFPPVASLIPGTCEKGPFFCSKEEAVARGLYSLGCVYAMSRRKALIHRHWTLHLMPHPTRTTHIGSGVVG